MAFAPAVAAIRAKAEADITFLPLAWEAEDYRPARAPWCLFEVAGGSNDIQGIGKRGDTLYGHDGLIRAFVHVPRNSGQTVALELADAIGAVFLRQDIPAPAAPDYVRTEQPRVEEGAAFDMNDAFTVVMVTIPFVFWHRR